jgi:hypothetical protein
VDVTGGDKWVLGGIGKGVGLAGRDVLLWGGLLNCLGCCDASLMDVSMMFSWVYGRDTCFYSLAGRYE